MTSNTKVRLDFLESGQGFSKIKTMKYIPIGMKCFIEVMNNRLLRGVKTRYVDYQ